MYHTTLSTIAAFNQFTGYEQTRIETLLGTLAVVSIIIWVLAGLCIVVCRAAVMLLSLVRRTHRSATNSRGSRHAY